MPPDWITELKGWQTGIGSFAGLVALMMGALFNYHLSRKRDAKLRNEEATSVAAAFYGEILALQNELTILARAVAASHLNGEGYSPALKIDRHFIEAHELSDPILLKALASKLGLLNADIVIEIMRFYASYMDAKRSLPLLVDSGERGYTFSCLAVLRPANGAVKGIAATLRSIEKLTAIATPFVAPSMGRVEDVIDMEETSFIHASSGQ